MHVKNTFMVIMTCALMITFEHTFLLAEANGAPNDCPEGITAYWSLEEDAVSTYDDAIGTNDGSCTGSACPVAALTGTVGNGQPFDGDNTITVNADAGFNWSATQSFTIELWMSRSTGTTGNPEVFIGRNEGALNWYIGINASGQATALLQASDGSGPGPLTGSKDLRSDSADATWHHVALVRNAGDDTITLYVDGDSSAARTFDFSAGFASDTAPLTIGSLNGNNPFDFGALDEVAVYGAALDEKTIKSHYYLARAYCSLYDTPVKIMPMGNSITLGIYSDESTPADPEKISYRLDLSDLFQSNLYAFDFIGSERNGQGVDSAFDQDHAGFSGIRADELLEVLDAGTSARYPDIIFPNDPYLKKYPTEVILLHIGTNGLTSGTNDVRLVLDEIDESDKNITVVLAKIINQSTSTTSWVSNTTVNLFNSNLQTLANDRIAQGDKIILVDMQESAGINYAFDSSSPFDSGDMYDHLHPNASGYTDMAGLWFTALETFLPQAEIPFITSTAPTDAVIGQLYSYTVVASGLPAPTFSLINSPPSGMTIDPVTGELRWTPSTAGDQAVTVRATNWAGQIDQELLITVSATPPVNTAPVAMADSYSGILQGDTFTIAVGNGVLQNDTDAENDTLSSVLVSDVSFGTLVLNADGSFTYTHDGSTNNNDSFTYTATDGQAESAPVTVTLTITLDDDPITPDTNGGGGGGGCFITSFD